MACTCWANAPQPHHYLITMEDQLTHRAGRIIVRSTCPHGFQEFVEELARDNRLVVTDPLTEQKFPMHNPVVTVVDVRRAAHVPLAADEVTL